MKPETLEEDLNTRQNCPKNILDFDVFRISQKFFRTCKRPGPGLKQKNSSHLITNIVSI